MKIYYPHSPPHIFTSTGTYIVTAATYQKQQLFKGPRELDLLQKSLLELAEHYKVSLKAWAIFPNHYHFIASCSENPEILGKLIKHLHASTARELNIIQNSPGRNVWYQCWDTHISYQPSYHARLNYVIQNPVKHKIVNEAADYRWCSARWFKENTTTAFYNTIIRYKIDAVNVVDDFDLLDCEHLAEVF